MFHEGGQLAPYSNERSGNKLKEKMAIERVARWFETEKSQADADFQYLAYDEDIDGFQFSRTRSKRIQAKEAVANAAAAPAKSDATEGAPVTDPRTAAKVPSKRKKGTSAVTVTVTTTNNNEPTNNQDKPPRRRSARLSGDKDGVARVAAPPSIAHTSAVVRRASAENAKRTKQQPNDAFPPKETDKEAEKEAEIRRPAISPRPVNEIRVEKKRTATKIALPFADTPIIQRNKDMRKNSGGHRRSSNGMRGRRASSLIEENKSNGMLPTVLHTHTSALPARSHEFANY